MITSIPISLKKMFKHGDLLDYALGKSIGKCHTNSNVFGDGDFSKRKH
jgi:hypothetical protein